MAAPAAEAEGVRPQALQPPDVRPPPLDDEPRGRPPAPWGSVARGGGAPEEDGWFQQQCTELVTSMDQRLDAQQKGLEELRVDLAARLTALVTSEAAAIADAACGRPHDAAARKGTAMLPPLQPEPPNPPEEVEQGSGDFSAEKAANSFWQRLSNGSSGGSLLSDAEGVPELNGHGISAGELAPRRESVRSRSSRSSRNSVVDNWNAISRGCSGVYESQRELFVTLQRHQDLHQGSVLYMLSDFFGCRQQIGHCFDRLGRKTEDRPACGRKAMKLVDNPNFAMIVTGLIVLNAVWIAVTSEDYMRRCLRQWDESWEAGGQAQVWGPPASTPEWMLVVDTVFAFLFALELIVRLAAQECTFFLGPDYRWNLLDLVVVFSCWVDLFMDISGFDDKANVSFLRIFRILRLLRSLRVVRILRFLREMRLILLSLLSSLWPLLWALLSLSMVMFTFVVVFMQGLAEYILDADEGDRETVKKVRVWFSGFWQSFLTLFEVITGGINWNVVYDPLASASFWYGNLFVVYVAIMVFGVLNVITGIFVECAVTKARADTDLSLQEEVDREKSMMKQLIQLFRVMDANMSGTISHDEWETFTRQPNAKAILTLLDLDIHKTHQIFQLIDADGSNEVDLEEFVMGCMKLQGGAKTVDLEAMLHNNKILVRKNLHQMNDLGRHIQQQLDTRLKFTEAEVRRLQEVTQTFALLLREKGILTASFENGHLTSAFRDRHLTAGSPEAHGTAQG